MDQWSPTWFDQLVAEAGRRAPAGGDAGDLLAAAASVSAEHAATADRLLDHFVGQAREAGVSWTEIGARLGVSKQAARQRFTGRVPLGTFPFAARPAPRLQACLDQAEQQAQADHAPEVGTEHLLIGLLAEGVAAAILERLHVTTDTARAATRRLFGSNREAATDQAPPLSAEAICALDAAARNAAAPQAGEPPVVRTEHLLAALALDPGSRARRVLNDLGVDIAALKREVQCYVTVTPPRPPRWWKRHPTPGPTCSFCGRTNLPPGQLVTGPGVAICVACLDLANEVRDRTHPARVQPAD